MASEMFLPPLVMEKVLSYFDTADCARMAQTSETWRRIVYRKSMWEKSCISYKSFPDLVLEVPPRGARHIGMTSKLCFMHWLMKVYHYRMDTLPLSLERRTDPSDFLAAFFRLWNRCGCPCIIKDHHQLTDLLRLPFPSSISKSEQKRILYRLISYNTSPIKNAYSHWVELQRNYLNPILVIPHVVSDDESSSDPLHRYRYAVLSVQRARLEKINWMLRITYDKYDACSNALMRRGNAEFETNDSWYRSNHEVLWGVAGFSCPRRS
jgi:hypothetical protein